MNDEAAGYSPVRVVRGVGHEWMFAVDQAITLTLTLSIKDAIVALYPEDATGSVVALLAMATAAFVWLLARALVQAYACRAWRSPA